MQALPEQASQELPDLRVVIHRRPSSSKCHVCLDVAGLHLTKARDVVH
jgi:hypothetical protein